MKETHMVIHGSVQGVGFRYFAVARAKELAITGYVKNTPNNTVEILAQGRPELLETFIQHMRLGPVSSQVERVDVAFAPMGKRYSSFEIRG